MASDGDPPEPERSVQLIAASNNGDTEVGNREQRTSHTCPGDAPGIEVGSFDHEKRPRKVDSETRNLRPQPTIGNRSMQVEDGLPLDSDAIGNEVVRHRKHCVGKGGAELLKHLDYLSGPLPVVNEYRH